MKLTNMLRLHFTRFGFLMHEIRSLVNENRMDEKSKHLVDITSRSKLILMSVTKESI